MHITNLHNHFRVSSAGTSVMEGSNGFDSTYDIYLRPCSAEMLEIIRIQITSTNTDQITMSPSELTGTHFDNAECKYTVGISAVDDDLVEGNHYTTILHAVKNSTSGQEILLTDGTPLYAQNVLVQIYDNDHPGVVVIETNGVTATAELDATGKNAIGDVAFYEDEYTIRLTKEPAGNVDIIVSSVDVASDVDIDASPSGRDFSARKQVLVNGEEIHTVTFTPTNWYDGVVLQVTAIDDDIEEGADWLSVAPRPSNLGMIQGPLYISGGYSPYIPPLMMALMLPQESNPFEFVVPSGAAFDLSNEAVVETKQVDTITFNHQDTNKVGADATIIPTHLLGAGMLRDLIFLGGNFDGIHYEETELLVFNFGDGDDILYVNETAEAIHVVNLDNNNETSNDYVDVRALSGPMLINGGNGLDAVNVSSAEERKVDKIRALLMFDGGEDEDTDTLFLDNSGDTDQNDIFNVTRGLVEMESMVARDEAFASDTNPFLPRQSYLVSLALFAFVLII